LDDFLVVGQVFVARISSMLGFLRGWRRSVGDFRRIADEIHGRFPFFTLSEKEFIERCLPLQRCGAGIVLGHPLDDFTVRIVEAPEAMGSGKRDDLPLGHFGEIIYRCGNRGNFTETGLYGFLDQRNRVWCCGPIDRSVSVAGKRLFPHCIEPIFERLPWVERARFEFFEIPGEGEPGMRLSLTVVPRKIFAFPVLLFRKKFLGQLRRFADGFKMTSAIDEFHIARVP
jgi:hypothetical protein